jgi:hypothetical protein
VGLEWEKSGRAGIHALEITVFNRVFKMTGGVALEWLENY